MNARQVRIFDTTLRDGEQTPGASLTPDEKVKIARQLDKLGVDTIEAGFPITSAGECESVSAVAKAGLSCEVIGLARANKADVDKVLSTGVESVHVFIATSDLHLKHKLKLSQEQVLDRIAESVAYAKRHARIVEFSAEDASRTGGEFLRKAYETAERSGADRINIPDTVGISSPQTIARITREVVSGEEKIGRAHV